ncbi:MAG TPA: hypothetical protein VF157_09420, partial [Chloroflexota bacterium]
MTPTRVIPSAARNLAASAASLLGLQLGALLLTACGAAAPAPPSGVSSSAPSEPTPLTVSFSAATASQSAPWIAQ